jgi:hypothetical protein
MVCMWAAWTQPDRFDWSAWADEVVWRGSHNLVLTSSRSSLSILSMITAAKETYALQRDLDAAENDLQALRWNDTPADEIAEIDASIQPLRDRVAERQAEIGGVAFRIPEENLLTLHARLEKLNKRADKLDVKPVSITEHGTEEIKTTRDGKTEYRVYVWVAVAGESPKLDGWRFVATLEHDENGVILRKLPTFDGDVDLTPYRTASPENCDHCKLNRRRNDTYIVQHDNGTLKQVGSNCLTDFLGGASPQQIARYMEYLADFMDELGDEEGGEFYGSSAPKRLSLDSYMTHVATCIRQYGWTSRGLSYDTGRPATADDASENLYNFENKKTDRQGIPMWIDPAPQDADLAARAIQWVRDLPEEALESDYLYNLFTVMKGESLGLRQLGIAASAISAYRKAVEKEVKKKAADKVKAESNFVGEVKDKIEITATCSRIKEINGTYGTTTIYNFIDDQGNQFTWFSSRDIDIIREGQGPYLITGTVKAHEDKGYGKTTVITRCKVS